MSASCFSRGPAEQAVPDISSCGLRSPREPLWNDVQVLISRVHHPSLTNYLRQDFRRDRVSRSASFHMAWAIPRPSHPMPTFTIGNDEAITRMVSTLFDRLLCLESCPQPCFGTQSARLTLTRARLCCALETTGPSLVPLGESMVLEPSTVIGPGPHHPYSSIHRYDTARAGQGVWPAVPCVSSTVHASLGAQPRISLVSYY